MSAVSDSHDYDPRYDRAQTIDGAKARYVTDDLPAYDETALERDVARLLRGGEYPDKSTINDERARPTIDTQVGYV